MDEYESLSQSKWECKDHFVFISKCRRKVLYENLRRHFGEVFRKLTERKECHVEKGSPLTDHIHMMISISPEHSVSSVVGFIKGTNAIQLARCMEIRSRITLEKASGHGDSLYRQSAETKPRFETTSATRKRKASVSTS